VTNAQPLEQQTETNKSNKKIRRRELSTDLFLVCGSKMEANSS
jgi:hypothetical protein